MSLFDQINGKINKLSEKIKDGTIGETISETGNNLADALHVGAKTAYGRARNAAEVGGLKFKLNDAEKQAASAYEKFGRKYMELHKEDEEPELAGELEAIRSAEAVIADLKKQIEDANEATKAAEADLKAKVASDREAARAAKKTEDLGDEFSEDTGEFTEGTEETKEEAEEVKEEAEEVKEEAKEEAEEEAKEEAEEAGEFPEADGDKSGAACQEADKQPEAGKPAEAAEEAPAEPAEEKPAEAAEEAPAEPAEEKPAEAAEEAPAEEKPADNTEITHDTEGEF